VTVRSPRADDRDLRRPAGPDELRLFVAVPIAAASIAAIDRLIAGLPAPRDGKPVRWVRTEGLHLTLRFLGQAPAAAVEPLSAIVDRLAASAAPFEVTIEGAGAFPSMRRPRALWLGVTDGASRLAELAAALDTAVANEGWESDERPFRPHLTLARSDGIPSGPATAAALAETAAGFSTSFVADRITLFRSRTGGGPARYEALHEGVLRP
jgi:2'-5' RNA ligase